MVRADRSWLVVVSTRSAESGEGAGQGDCPGERAESNTQAHRAKGSDQEGSSGISKLASHLAGAHRLTHASRRGSLGQRREPKWCGHPDTRADEKGGDRQPGCGMEYGSDGEASGSDG
jgi:hypothetical protein